MLYVIATPIGNPDDISKRALTTLKEIDFIFTEHIRTTRKLLDSYDIDTSSKRFYEYFDQEKIDIALELLEGGEDLGLVSEAGTPTLADSGARLVEKVSEAGFKVVPIPGPSALTAAASISGFAMNRFLFLGFPRKRMKGKFFEEVAEAEYPVVIFESASKLIETLNEIRRVVPSKNRVLVAQNLTKKSESIYRGSIEEVIEKAKQNSTEGEYAIVVDKGWL